jgi:hypothetical protein
MSISKHVPNVPQVRTEDVTHAKLREVIDKAVETKSPPVAWYRTMGQRGKFRRVLLRSRTPKK